ncbi:YiiD C-terminal domain-containing protein [Nocardia rhizosphaerae]|uniref:YiiD C-terminal domain-containing protein n=1 Tax=Nocardia rhizosphaerae TaxID=1691571 RepID=A0ABV8L3X4_9NOCA
MSEDDNSLVDMVNMAIEATIPAAASMGVRAVEVGRGHAVTTVPIEGNGNHFGAIYAGVQFTVAEVLGGAITAGTFDTSAFYPLVKSFDIAFRAMARTDLRAEATLAEDEIVRVGAEAAERGKADFVLEAVVTDTDGTTIATTRGVYQLRAFGR